MPQTIVKTHRCARGGCNLSHDLFWSLVPGCLCDSPPSEPKLWPLLEWSLASLNLQREVSAYSRRAVLSPARTELKMNGPESPIPNDIPARQGGHGREAAVHSVSAVRKQRNECCCSAHGLFSQGSQVRAWCCPHSGYIYLLWGDIPRNMLAHSLLRRIPVSVIPKSSRGDSED